MSEMILHTRLLTNFKNDTIKMERQCAIMLNKSENIIFFNFIIKTNYNKYNKYETEKSPPFITIVHL